MGRETISACLIVRDEQERLGAALEGIGFCDEIVVVDSGSKDRTAQIARAAGAVVVENPWPGFSRQRNVAIDHAGSDWILELDADERVSPELRRDIERFLSGPPPHEVDMAAIPLRDRFLGRELGPSAKYPKYRSRLFRRGAYRHDEDLTVHEGLWVVRPVVALGGDLEHELAGTWREAVTDAWTYARLEAQHVGHSGSPLELLLAIAVRPPVKLVYRTVVDGGWRDGWQGMVKIALDCLADAVTAVRRLATPGDAPRADRDPPLVGAPRIAALAAGSSATLAADRWLDAARLAGADTVLITDAVEIATSHHRRRVERVGPLLTARGLDAEQQLRPVEGVVPFGRRAEVVARAVPGHLRGPAGVLSPQPGAPRVLESVGRARRDGASRA